MRGRKQLVDRRKLLFGIGGTALTASGLWSRRAAGAADPVLTTGLPQGVYDTAELEALPDKKPLIRLSFRPPNYETPLAYFDSAFTPNDAFFIRYHLADIPERPDAASWRIRFGGDGATSPVELGLADIKGDFEQVEIAAVCQCSGNRRGLSDPHVPGVQWGVGAMGNARWKGVRLKDVLAKVGLRKEAIEIVVNGADLPVLDKTPRFVKSLPIWKALDENTLIAWEMNGQPLPHFNGFPVRLVVPGWTATYWMKHLSNVEIATRPFDGFWMKTAYRIPTGKFPVMQHFLTQMTETSEPITEMVVNSLVVSPAPARKVRAGRPLEIRGIAWDGGYGIRRVELSLDGGTNWGAATLGADDGRFAFRSWSFRFTPAKPGAVTVLARASNVVGQTQAEVLIFNPAGYHNNVVRPLRLTVV
jgi:DMSO/TMAO reductase YedYZ molybdopterin-dependent catalytic subunit